MKRLALLTFFFAVCTASSSVSAQVARVHRMELGSARAPQGSVAEISLTLTTTSQIQGLVAVFQWDENLAEGVDLIPGGILDDADLLVKRIEGSYMVLGAVMDSDGQDGEIIDAGDGLDLASAKLRCLVGGDTRVPLEFTPDGLGFSAVNGGPDLDNQLTSAGLSIGRQEGLELSAGELLCLERPRITFRLGDGTAGPAGCGDVSVVMDHPEDDIEGFELSIAHPPGLTLESISIEGTAVADNGADFSQSETFDDGGTLGVVMDLVAPFDGNTLPAGVDQTVAFWRYCCQDGLGPEARAYDLTFQAGFGSPPKENTAVVGGMSVVPELENGSFTCPAAGGEICDDGIDNDGDDLIDCDDPDCEDSLDCDVADQTLACGSSELADDGLPFTAEGSLGGTTRVSFFYQSPDQPGSGADQIQGLSIAVCYACELTCVEGSYDITDTIVEAVGAEFLSHQCDNDPDDGDGCEMIIGMLVDALPPFDGATLPPTSTFLSLGSVEFEVDDDPSICGGCLPIEFCDGINGRGVVPTRNLVSIENFSYPVRVINCELCVGGPEIFYRGDCNSNGEAPYAVDVADSAAILSFLFLEGSQHFEPPCQDACDSNDDGRIDLADAVSVLNFLFLFGDFPPAPGPGFTPDGTLQPPGPDPSEDPLGCEDGAGCD